MRHRGGSKISKYENNNIALFTLKSEGCGEIITYFKNNLELAEIDGVLWCGMPSKSVKNNFFKCRSCYITENNL